MTVFYVGLVFSVCWCWFLVLFALSVFTSLSCWPCRVWVSRLVPFFFFFFSGNAVACWGRVHGASEFGLHPPTTQRAELIVFLAVAIHRPNWPSRYEMTTVLVGVCWPGSSAFVLWPCVSGASEIGPHPPSTQRAELIVFFGSCRTPAKLAEQV